jgi:hypothetical protein
MMKTKEIFESISCGEYDDHARRVLNMSAVTVNITAEELEKGVSLEQLETINTPVFRYKTQITIHGVVPDFNPHSRPGGYKSLIENKNGTLGVRYSAIDAEKKQLIGNVLRESKDFFVQQSSTEFFILKTFTEKADAIAAIVKLRKLELLIYGEITAGCCMYGGYFAGLYLSAIRKENIWPFLAELGPIKTQEQYDALMAEQQAIRDADAREAEEKRASRTAEVLKQHAANMELYAGKRKVTAISYPLNCTILRVSNYEGATVKHYQLTKSGRWVYDNIAGVKVKKSDLFLTSLETNIQKGQVFYAD